jgi:hypothetical protein
LGDLEDRTRDCKKEHRRLEVVLGTRHDCDRPNEAEWTGEVKKVRRSFF